MGAGLEAVSFLVPGNGPAPLFFQVRHEGKARGMPTNRIVPSRDRRGHFFWIDAAESLRWSSRISLGMSGRIFREVVRAAESGLLWPERLSWFSYHEPVEN